MPQHAAAQEIFPRDRTSLVTNLYNGLAFLLSGPLDCELCISKKKKKKEVN